MPSRELTIAFLVFLIAAASAGYSYREVLREREKSIISLDGLTPGAHARNLLSNGQCLGFINYTFERSAEDSYAITGAGELWVVLGDSKTTFKISIEAFFNKLGQLGGSVFQFVSGKNQILLGSSGTNPIEIALRVQLEDSGKNEKRFQLPGPISLKKTGGNTFQIHSALFRSLAPAYKRISEQPMLSGFNLSTSTIDDKLDCRSQEKAGLLLDPLLKLFGTLERGADFLLPPVGK